MPLFSVIVPIYKVEKYLSKCVESILQQEYDDFELLLIDDGSPDRCPDICDSYANRDQRVRVIHKKNGGLVSARKAGALAAKGEYILNVDGDDWVSNDFFYILDKVVNEKNPDILCFGYEHAWENESVVIKPQLEEGFYTREEIEQIIFPILIESDNGIYFTPSVWSKAIRRNIYAECQTGVDERISIGEDFACTRPALYKAESISVIHNVLYSYRQNEQSMTKNKKAFSLLAPELILHQFRETFLHDKDLMDQVYRNFVHNMFNASVSQFNLDESYKDICSRLNTTLNSDYINDAIRKCRYKSLYFKGQLSIFCLRYKLYFLMFLINKSR